MARMLFCSRVSAEDLVCADEEFVLRNWIVGKESNYLENLQPQIDALRLNVIVIQFNYGFFNHRELSAFIRRQHDAGRSVVMTMHSTVDPLEKEPTRISGLPKWRRRWRFATGCWCIRLPI